MAAATPLENPPTVVPDDLRVGYIWTCGTIPSKETDSQQVVSTVDALAGEGLAVDLVLPGRYRTLFSGRSKRIEAEIRAFYDVHRPFNVRALYTVWPTKPIEIERPVHAVVASVLRAAHYDVVHTRSRATVLTCAAIGQPVVFETYRLLGRDRPHFTRMLARAARRPAFLGVICHSQQCADNLAASGLPREKLAVVHNGYDPRKLEPRLTRAEARAKLGLALDRPVVAYTGNVQRQKGLDSVLAMAERTPEVTYLLVGGQDGHLAELREEIARRGLENVQTPGWFPAAELPTFMYAADALIIPPTAGPLQEHGRTVLPMKVFTYLAAGRPILAPALPDLAEVLDDGDNAALVAPDDTDAAVAALRRILGDPGYAERIAAGALASSQGLSWDARARRVAGLYREWLGRL